MGVAISDTSILRALLDADICMYIYSIHTRIYTNPYVCTCIRHKLEKSTSEDCNLKRNLKFYKKLSKKQNKKFKLN